ncbi:multidrug efflux SMR transporter [Erysipelotrichaceae bacterium OttesenSCG-928-M19]|nr:multidrug efflux SMR transporter [Erysipelotrichaceae bacterium OttesenSCG-928-M19]
MAWFILIISSCFEVLVMINLAKSNGFKNIKYTLLALVFQVISILLLGYTLQYLSINLAYATWTGLGTIGSVIYGIIFLNETRDYRKFIFMSLIMIGIIGLKLTT